jgi:MYXO-CTERM domain-containing protein
MLAFVAVLSTDLTGVLATKQASDGLEAPAITSSAAKSDVANEPAAPKPDVGQDIAIDIPPISAAAPAPEESTSLPFAAPKDAKSQESRAEGLLPPDELTATEGLEVEQDGEGVQPEAATSDELTLPAEETSQESPAGTALAAPLPGDEGTPTYWRVVESVLGALAALLAGAFVWRRRRASTR